MNDSFDKIYTEFVHGPLPCWNAVARLVALGHYDKAQAEHIVTAWTHRMEKDWHDDQELRDAANSSDLKYRMWRQNQKDETK
jgi:hypothetical protein